MSTAYTSLLGLALPVTGELSGTWGDTVNDYITRYVDAAVAGAQTISGSQTAVTLSTTNGSSLAQAGSGATGSAQYSILNCTGNPASLLTITAPATSKVYLVLNSTSTAQSVKVVGSGPTTGVTVATGKAALIAWNGSDFALVASTDASKLTGVLAVANGGTGLSSYTAGDLVYASGATTISKLAIGAANTVLTSSGTAPQWSSSLDGLTTVDTTNLEVTNIKAKDGTAVAVLTDSTGALDISKAVTMSATTQNIALGTSQTSGTFTVGGAAQTGTQTFDQSTKAHTLNIGTGATENATTKTINIGTGGVSGSTTTITIGAATGTTTTVNGTLNATTLDLTNLEVTNIKAKDGTAAMSIADSTGVVSITANPILSGGTQNGVVYLNSSRVATTGSALTFDGTNFGLALSQNAATKATLTNSNAGTSASARYEASNGSNTAEFGIRGTAQTTNGVLAAQVAYAYSPSSAGLALVGAAGPIMFAAGGTTESMRIGSAAGGVGALGIGYTNLTSVGDSGLAVAGNVGIGTSAPAYKLDVVGPVNLQSTATFPATGLMLRSADNELKVVGGSAGIAFAAASGASTYATIDSSGNLGIGTTSPNSPAGATQITLHISNATAGTSPGVHITNGDTGTNTGDGTLIFVGNAATTGSTSLNIYNQENSPICFFTNTTEKARITSGGGFVTKPTAGNETAFNEDGVDADFRVEGDTDANLIFADASTDRVGIGTSSPAYKLDVQGSGVEEAIRIRTTASSGDATLYMSSFNATPGNNIISFGDTNSGGSGQIIYAHSNDSMQFKTAGTERARISSDGTFRVKGAGTAGSTDAVQFSGSAPADAMRLDTSGNLGVGTTSAINNSGYGGISLNGTSGALFSMLTNGTESSRIASIGNETSIQCKATTGYITFVQGVSGGTERARITSGGDLLVNSTTAVRARTGQVQIVATSAQEALTTSSNDLTYSQWAARSADSGAGTHYLAYFEKSTGTAVGSITHDNTNTAYNTSSDYRLKDNQQPLTGSGAFIDALKPKTWTWKESGDTGVGFIAHEVQEVSPSSVVGEKDAVDADGKPVIQAMEYGSAEFIANIIAELQSLRARVAQLEQGA